MKFKLAILNVLAKSSGRHLTLDEVKREAKLLAASEGQTAQLQRFSALGDFDIFKSGLILRDEAGLQITEAGRSLLQSLESESESAVFPTTSGLQLIDDLVGTEERRRIFDLEPREVDDRVDQRADFDPNRSELDAEDGLVTTGMTEATSEAGARENIHNSILAGTDDRKDFQPSSVAEEQRMANEPVGAAPQGAPTFSQRSFDSMVQEPGRSSHRRAKTLAYIAGKLRLVSAPWRGHFAQGASNPKTQQPVGRVGGAAFALLSLLVLIACAGAVIAFVQIKSLKLDIALLNREVLPLRERLARLEQAEKSKQDSDQQDSGLSKSGAPKNKPVAEIQPPLNLSREEIQLVRDFIKPAPSGGPALPPINVGDSVGGATIPLPSQLTEKVPKLFGARFTTRNGAIIILRRDSRQADAVLPPN